jgi:hypothetical protein
VGVAVITPGRWAGVTGGLGKSRTSSAPTPSERGQDTSGQGF